MGKQVAAGFLSKKKTTHESVLYRTDISEWAELITKPVRPKGEKDVLT